MKTKTTKNMVKIGLLGQKIKMTQIFDKHGKAVPITILKTGPCFVTQIKVKEKEGYNAIQIGYSSLNKKKDKNVTKPILGHLNKHELPVLGYLKEYKVTSPEIYKIGEIINLNRLKIEEKVNLTALSLGKGTVGNVKQHKFNRGAMTHGSKHHRLQGSIGSGTTPGRVFPGKRMPKKKGNQKVTIKNLEILFLDIENHLLAIKGSVPGKFGNLVSIKN